MIFNYDVSDIKNKINDVAEDLSELSSATEESISDLGERIDAVADDLSDLTETVESVSDFDDTPTQDSANAVTSGGVFNALHGSIVHPNGIEFQPEETDNHGGYLDFHYNGSSADYTTRVVENASGQLDLIGNLRVNGNVPITTAVVTVSDISINRNDIYVGTVTATKAGYTPLGIVEVSLAGDGSGSISLSEFFKTNVTTGSCTINFTIRNEGSTDLTGITFKAAVLWSAFL